MHAHSTSIHTYVHHEVEELPALRQLEGQHDGGDLIIVVVWCGGVE